MNRDLGFISLSLLTWGLGEAAFLAFQPLYLQNLGADPIQIGTIYGAYGLAASLVHIPAGYLSDRLGRRPAMWSAWFIGVIATWMMALANSLPWFVAGMLLYGSTMFVIAPMNSYVTTARGKFTVARALTLISATYNVGTILGPLLGGYIGERLGIRAIFFIAAGIFLCSTIFILFIRPQPLDSDSKQERGKPIFANTRFLAFLPVIFLIIFAGYLPQPLSPNFLQNHRGLTLTNIGQLYSINGLGIVVLNLLLGQMRSGAGLVLGQLCVGAFALLLWKGSGFLSFSLAYFLLGGFRTTRLLALAAARPLVKQSEMGLSYGLIETAGAIAVLTASPLAGYLYDRNPLLIYAVSAGLILLSSLISLTFLYNRPQIQRPEMISVEEG